MPLRALAQLWVSGALATLYPDHVRKKRSSRSDRGRFDKYILPLIGDRPVSEFEGVRGLELAELVMRKLPPPEQLSRDSRRQIAQILHRLFALAVYPLRLLDSNPLPRGWLPKGSAPKAKSYLYPEEDAKLLAKTKVPLLNRLFYGFLAREGLRSSEARGLLVSDVDLRNGVCNLDRNKTDDPRTWVLSPGVLEALQRYLERHRPEAKPDEALFVDPSGRGPPSDNLGRALRRDLKTAGVERAQLFTSSAERIHMRGHDLRATFVTINLANGKTETWISDRTGHKSSQMIARYRRMARTHAELNLGDLKPLASAIPELSASPAKPPVHEQAELQEGLRS
jgi:integrase